MNSIPANPIRRAIPPSNLKHGSIHVTIKIGFIIGYYDDDRSETEELQSKNTKVVESGKAFTSHKNKVLKNSKVFPKFIIENIQSVFWRAGYTPEALGIELDKTFDFSKFRL